MASGDYDGLFKAKSWRDGLSKQATEWLAGLAVACVEADAEPVWAEARRRFVAKFPDDAPSIQTFRDKVREIIAEQRHAN